MNRRPPSRWLPLALTALAVCLGTGPALAARPWKPNESLVTPNPGLIDYEFSQSRAKFVWTDQNGVLWLADVDPDTGDFSPRSGRGTQIATNTVSKFNMFLWNGPEWISMPTGDQIAFSYYVAGKPPTIANTRMALAVQSKTGDWVPKPLGPVNAARMFDVSSHTPGDADAQIMYFDSSYNHYWRNVTDASSEQLLSFLPAEDKAWRLGTGTRAILYTALADGVSQVFSYQPDTTEITQLTFDSGDKDTGRTVPWIWPAPEFGGDLVFSTVVDDSELRVYRQVSGGPGWTLVFSSALPSGHAIGSPEWFVYNGKSYLFMCAYVEGADYPSEIWVSNIDADHPLLRQIADQTELKARNDPEVFITSQYGPMIYYNRYDPTLDPDHPLCARCSEGVYRANPGLKGM